MSEQPSDLRIQGFTLGQWQTNCYVVSAGGDCWIIDVGFDPEAMLDWIDEQGLRPTQIVLTHGHLDHIAGVQTARQRYPEIPILIHEIEKEFLSDTLLNLSAAVLMPVIAPEATRLLTKGESLTLGDFVFEVRHTPGHSPGGISLIQPDSGIALVGDTLFAGSVGRYDFPTSDGPLLFTSIQQELMTLDDNTRVLPGHGPETTIGQERRSNPYLQQHTRSGGLVG